MDFLKRHKLEVLFIVLLFLLYFTSRFINILAIPIFTDEAIYIRWAQIAKQDANWRFISLTDGKQPSFVWITMIVMRFISDPLLAGRFTSILSGFFTMIGLFLLSYQLFKNRKIAYLTSLLYIFYPFALMYDRMALYESLVAMFFVWALYLEVLLVKHLRLDIALLLGLVIGGGVLTKTTGFIGIYLLPTALILFDFKHKDKVYMLLKFIIFSVISSALAYGMYAILRLSPYFHIISEKNAIFFYPFHEWIKHPFEFFDSNFRGLLDWVIGYMSLPVFLLVPASFLLSVDISKTINTKSIIINKIMIPLSIIAGAVLVITLFQDTRDNHLRTLFIYLFSITSIAFIYALIHNKIHIKEKLILVIWFVAPFLALALFGNTLYPRYVFFMSLPLIPLISYTLISVKGTVGSQISYALFLIFSAIFLYKSYYVLFDPANAPIPYSDRSQYITDWPSGVGINEAVRFFKTESAKGTIFVATQGTFGLMPYALEIYLHSDSNIVIKGYWPLNDQIPAELVETAKRMPTYVVFYQRSTASEDKGIAPATWPLSQIFQIHKGGNSYLTVYQVSPK